MQNYWLSEQHKDNSNEMAHDTPHKLPPAEQEFANALMAIAKKYGKLSNGDGNGIWVGYVDASENDNAEIGVMCSNCALYAGGGVCKIVKQKVQDGGYCRLAAIPDGVVDVSKKDDDDDDED
jgi:hypothetical protein